MTAPCYKSFLSSNNVMNSDMYFPKCIVNSACNTTYYIFFHVRMAFHILVQTWGLKGFFFQIGYIGPQIIGISQYSWIQILWNFFQVHFFLEVTSLNKIRLTSEQFFLGLFPECFSMVISLKPTILGKQGTSFKSI